MVKIQMSYETQRKNLLTSILYRLGSTYTAREAGTGWNIFNGDEYVFHLWINWDADRITINDSRIDVVALSVKLEYACSVDVTIEV